MTDQRKPGYSAGAQLLRDRLRRRSPDPDGDGTVLPRVSRSGPLALSFGQRRLWVLDRLRPGGADFLVPIVLRLRGDLDSLDIGRALTELVRRHEIFRTRYTTDDGEPVAVIDPPTVVKLPCDDLSGADSRALDALLQEDASHPFDLSASPVLRARLVRLSPDEHVLSIVVHHIAMDGWSSSLLVRELAALCEDREPAEPQVQYADFAAWQRDRADRAQNDLDHWTERLRDLPGLDLLTDHPRPAVWSPEGETLSFRIPADRARSLAALANEHRATPYMVYLAAFFVLLSRHTGQTDLAVATPIAGRTHPGVQDLIGLFINLLVIRADLSGSPSFGEFLDRVRSVALEAYEHQEVPFERVVDALDTGRNLSTHPLVGVNFTFQNNEPARFEAGGVTGEPITLSAQQAKFDLSWTLEEQPDGTVTGEATFPYSLFGPETVRTFTDQYVHLLGAVAADPGTAVGELPLMGEAQDGRLTSGPVRSTPTGPCLHERFAEQARSRPDAVAVTYGCVHLTYGELDTRANRLAHRLRELGAGREELVGICLPRGLELTVALLGVLKAGAAYLPLDPDHPAERFRYLLDDTGARIVVTDGGLSDRIAEAAGSLDHTVVLDGPEEAARMAGMPGEAPRVGAHPDDLAYTIYTSGSTGRPKGVQVPHSNVVRLLTATEPEYGFGPEDVGLMAHSFAFDVSVWEIWGALCYGGRLVIVPAEIPRSPWDLAEVLAAEGVTVLNQTPSAFRSLVELAERGDLTPERFRLRLVVFGGEALDPASLEPWWDLFGGATPQLVNMYGITETTVHTTYRPVGPADLGGDRSPVGEPIGDLSVYVLDENLRPAPVGAPGEIHVSGPGVARGYLGRPALTAERFVPDPYGPPGSRMYRSGDKARVLTNGDTGFLGRYDDQVKIRGFRIEPGEIESRLTDHPDVRSAAVLVDRSEDGMSRLVAYVVPDEGKSVSAPGLRSYLSASLPSYMVPAFFVPLDGLPLTVNGKLDRRALPSPEYSRQSNEVFVPPSTDQEREMARIWSQTLGVDQIGTDDNFFSLGGDSILAVRLVGRIREAGFAYSVQDLFRHQNIAELLGAAEGGTGGESAGVEPFSLISAEDRQALPETVVDAYPLTQTQAGMVYELLTHPGRNNYHNVTSYLIRDDEGFDGEALTAAADAVVAAQEILRTSFDLSRSEPLQLVHSSADVEAGHADLRGLDEQAMHETMETFRDEERARVFDLATAPLIRIHSHRISDDRWYLSLTECHAILDGWSHNSLVSELLAAYRAVRDSGRPVLEEGASGVRFADFVAEERRTLEDPAAILFWSERLAAAERLTLPEAWSDPEGPEDYIVRISFRDLESGLRDLAARAGASLKSVLIAAHVAVWSTVTNGPFYSGLVCNGRPEFEGGDRVRGMFLNTVPFVASTGAGTWRELVGTVFTEEVELWPHRRFPMPELQRRFADGGRLMDVAFNYLDFHVLDRTLVDTGESTDVSLNEFPLCAVPQGGDLLLVGKSRWVGRDRAEMLVRMYRRALELMVGDPDGDVRADLLPEQERSSVLSGRDTAPVPLLEQGLHERVAELAGSAPEAVALETVAGETVRESLTYRELWERAEDYATALRTLGVGPGDRVGTCLPRTADLVTAVLGTLAVGAAYVPLDENHPVERIAGILAGCGARAVVADATTAALLSEDAFATLVTEEVGRHGADGDAPTGPYTPAPNQAAYIVHTSGSTGRPKGVTVSHGALADRVRSMRADMDTGPGDAVVSVVPTTTDVWQLDVFYALLCGARLVLADADAGRDPVSTAALLRSSGATLMQASPTTWRMLTEAGWVPPEGFDVVSGGEAINPDLAHGMVRSGARVWDMYGPSEATVFCCGTRFGAGADDDTWVLAPNTTAYILDEELRPVPWGVAGQIVIGGASLATGYAGEPGMTAGSFLPDPYASKAGSRMYLTGDLGVRERNSRLRVLGRIDDQVKIQGFRVEPGEVEGALSAHEGVRSVVVHPFTDPLAQRRLAAYVLFDGESAPEELLRYSEERLPAHMVPTSFVPMETFPRLPNGKIDRRSLPVPGEGTMNTARVYEPPREGTEQLIADVWSEALGIERVGRDDDFFALGGHSLLVLRITAWLQREHNLQLTPRDLLEYRTVAELARAADTGTGQRRSTLIWLGEQGEQTPLFCLHPGGGSAHWYRSLAEEYAGRRPLGAFEWPGLHSRSEGSTDLAEVARLYLNDLREARPEGPYNILGWCGSSGIAWEIARHLRAEGEHCRLVLIDPIEYPSTRFNPLEGQAERLRRAEHLLWALHGEVEAEEGTDPRAELTELLRGMVDDGERPFGPEALDFDDSWRHRLRSWREIVEARLRYRFPEYDGFVEIIVCEELAEGEYESIVGRSFEDYLDHWRGLARGGVRHRRTPGDHQTALLPPHVAALATTLSEIFDKEQ
ncbi:hypothetical protein GCM10007147_42630 [Nocardiopsis kunsanensis]|uniref:Carrier domain-containing protein n=1 Tax=Nocardiopsis kunsanensis TaxID=141693 RepID=A0A919CL41_9ACTN|nr:non-ribosomal peptide synthetase [Nocardiopsis kunsanensis]GHD35857.1 hypothetical protein GCM10007147_42630 [Nocardiopsis kunsanensis]